MGICSATANKPSHYITDCVNFAAIEEDSTYRPVELIVMPPKPKPLQSTTNFGTERIISNLISISRNPQNRDI
jgi:hypothetical protein